MALGFVVICDTHLAIAHSIHAMKFSCGTLNFPACSNNVLGVRKMRRNKYIPGVVFSGFFFGMNEIDCEEEYF